MHSPFNRQGSLILAILFAMVGAICAQEPEHIYYKFNEASGTTTANFALPGSGLNPATLNGQMLGAGGQFGRALVGVGGSSTTNFVNTGWQTTLGSGSWTVGFWFDNTTTGSGGTLQYLFGDNTANQWRIYSGGMAGSGNLVMRGGGLTDIPLAGGASATSPVVVAWTYDSVAGVARSYLNGVLASTVPQGAVNIVGTANLKIGGFFNVAALFPNGRMDEVRIYNRALSAAEIAATWNIELNNRPRCTLNSPAPGAAISGTVLINYDALHGLGMPIDATFEYSLNGGFSWQPATPTGSSVNPTIGIATPSLGRIFDWDTFADAIALTAPATADFRITVIDGGARSATCSVTAMSADNRPPPPSCTLNRIGSGTAFGPIGFDFTPNSVSAPTVDATFHYSLNGGATFIPATPGGAATNPMLGVPIAALANFTWNSRADNVGLTSLVPNVILRATVTDGTPQIGTCLSAPFDVLNTSLCPGLCGDCNTNGLGPDVLDSLAAAQISSGIVVATPAQIGCCDVNSSTIIEVLDALFMAQFATGLAVPIVCP